jgi:hypothetical protein
MAARAMITSGATEITIGLSSRIRFDIEAPPP